jgi:hypothetical protein
LLGLARGAQAANTTLEAILQVFAIADGDAPAGFAKVTGVGFLGMGRKQSRHRDEDRITNVATEAGDDGPGVHVQLRVISEAATKSGKFAAIIAGAA